MYKKNSTNFGNVPTIYDLLLKLQGETMNCLLWSQSRGYYELSETCIRLSDSILDVSRLIDHINMVVSGIKDSETSSKH